MKPEQNLPEILSRIEARLTALKLTANAASRAAGKADAIRNIQRAVKSQARNGVSVATLSALAPVLKTSLEWLVSGKSGLEPAAPLEPVLVEEGREPEVSNVVAIGERHRVWRAPIVSSVAAGHWSETVRVEELPPNTRFLDVYTKPFGQIFALVISGESMEPTFSAGDVVVIDTGLEPLPGDFVAARLEGLGGETTFKKYRLRGYDDDGEPIIDLLPLNQDYPPLVMSAERPGVIIGTMIEHRRFRRRK